MKIVQSKKLLKEAKKLIPTGGQTFSKGTHSFSENFSPSHAFKGEGNKIMDVDKNVYLDFVMGAQPLILGYADKDVNRAVKKQLDQGSTFLVSQINLKLMLQSFLNNISLQRNKLDLVKMAQTQQQLQLKLLVHLQKENILLFVDTMAGMIGLLPQQIKILVYQNLMKNWHTHLIIMISMVLKKISKVIKKNCLCNNGTHYRL